jgi:hypothetical protein
MTNPDGASVVECIVALSFFRACAYAVGVVLYLVGILGGNNAIADKE